MRRCEICTAVHDPETQTFLVAYGPPVSELTASSRWCQYARQRGRHGCINPCRAIDARETLSGRMDALEARISSMHPEVRECIDG